MDTYQRTAVVGSCPSRPEAELQRHVLEESGIRALIGSDDAGGLHPELAFTRCATYRLLVPEDRVDEARAILDSFEPEAPAMDVAAAAPDHPDDPARARVGLGRSATFWIAVILAAVLIGAALSNAINVLTILTG